MFSRLSPKWLLDDQYVIENNIDILVHGEDNSNEISACGSHIPKD